LVDLVSYLSMRMVNSRTNLSQILYFCVVEAIMLSQTGLARRWAV